MQFFVIRAVRIHYVIDQYEPYAGGTETQLRLLLQGMTDAGHDVRLFVFRATPFLQRPVGFPCPIECLDIGSMISASGVTALRAFRQRLAKDRPTAVHAFFNDAAIAVPLASVGLPVRVLSSRRDLGFWYTPAVLTALRVANRRVDLVVCNCEAVRNEVVRRESLDPARTRVIYNAVLPPSPKSATSSNDQVRICMIANARPLKRIEDLVWAASLVRRTQPNVSFLVIGHLRDDEYGRSLRALVESLNLTTAFEFLGSHEDPSAVLQACHIGVLTSSSEGLSNAVMEYMRCGLPVVCSEVGGNPELIRHEFEGLLFRAGYVDGLAACLSRLSDDPALRQQLGQRGQCRVREFSVSRIVDAHVAAYKGL